MNNKGNQSSSAKNVALTNERILNECEKLGTKEEKITYLKKVISDCQRIINFAETLGGKVLDVDLLKKAEQNIDKNLIMLLEGLCKPPAGLAADPPVDKVGRQEKPPLLVKQPRKYYIVSPVDGGRVCDIESAIEAMKVYKESIKDQIAVIEAVDKNKEMPAVNARERIKIKTSFADIVRNFESMFEADWISSKTPIRKIAEIFFSEIPDQIKFVNSYYSTKEQINKSTSSSSDSEKVAKFIMLLAGKSLTKKKKELDEIINFLIELRK